MSECLVISRSELVKTSFWDKLRKDKGVVEDAIPLSAMEVQEFKALVSEKQKFMERKGEGGVETMPEWQQVIMYAVVTQDQNIFVYERGGANSQNGEQRLASKRSIGVGGHIEPFDDGLEASLGREIDEEIVLVNSKGEVVGLGDSKVSIEGLVKYDGTEVDSVHVGLVCRVDLTGLDVKPMIRAEDGANISGEMMSLVEFRQRVDSGLIEPEHWTRLIIDRMADQIIKL